MPNTNPPTNTVRAFRDKIKIAKRKSLVDFGLHAGTDKPKEIRELANLKPASYKIFMDLLDDDHLMNLFL